jgi:hypothetical protein
MLEGQMRVPDESDWGDWKSDLDQSDAHRVFSGKTVQEVRHEFAMHPIERADNLRFMPPVPFQYYICAFKDFLLSSDSKGHGDAASSYLRLLEDKLTNDPAIVMAVMPSLLPSVDSIAERQAFYEADEDIYGSFSEIRDRLHRAYRIRLSGKT